jgi:ribosomal protein S18 acetylase RimI-like enzyme
MINIQKANKNHINDIIKLATETWQATYCNIISQEQIDYMLNLFYSQKRIEEQIIDPSNHFLVALENDELLGYCHCFEKNGHYYISKIYVHPLAQGNGIGKLLMNHIEKNGIELKFSTLELNVNRNNPAKDFYANNGFKIVEEIDIPLDKFWLNDYIMQKEI